MNNKICVLDFCGSAKFGFHVEYWADYYPDEKKTVFGGDYWNIPDYLSDICPEEQTLFNWVDKYILINAVYKIEINNEIKSITSDEFSQLTDYTIRVLEINYADGKTKTFDKLERIK